MDSPSASLRQQKTNVVLRDKKSKAAASKLKLQQQKDKRKHREKKRFGVGGVSYMASTEGTTSDECDTTEDSSSRSHDNHHDTHTSSAVTDRYTSSVTTSHPQRHSFSSHSHATVPSTLCLHPQLSSKFQLSLKGNKSPSDLDADDEDNQEYDSASMVSQSECLNIAKSLSSRNSSTAMQNEISNSLPNNFGETVRQISIDGIEELTKQCQLSGTASSNEDTRTKPDRPFKKGGSSELMQQLREQDDKISRLEKLLSDLTTKLHEKDVEIELLRLENRKLALALGRA